MRNKPFKGEVKLSKDSGLRKLARAMRRDKLPPERAVIIETAERKVKERKREGQ